MSETFRQVLRGTAAVDAATSVTVNCAGKQYPDVDLLGLEEVTFSADVPVIAWLSGVDGLTFTVGFSGAPTCNLKWIAIGVIRRKA